MLRVARLEAQLKSFSRIPTSLPYINQEVKRCVDENLINNLQCGFNDWSTSSIFAKWVLVTLCIFLSVLPNSTVNALPTKLYRAPWASRPHGFHEEAVSALSVFFSLVIFGETFMSPAFVFTFCWFSFSLCIARFINKLFVSPSRTYTHSVS